MLTLEIMNELLEGREPKIIEEKEYITKFYEGLKRSQIKSEEYNKRKELADKEIEQLLKKYAPKEYWSDRFYNSDEFKQIEKIVEKRVTQEILNFPKKFLSHCHSEIYFRRRKQQIIRKEYGYKWYDISNLMPEEYWDEKHEIAEKYNVANI